MKKDHKELVEQLELLRLEKKIPQTQLAEKLGVAFSTVNRWFNGRSQPNHIQRYHIRKMLGKDHRCIAKQQTKHAKCQGGLL